MFKKIIQKLFSLENCETFGVDFKHCKCYDTPRYSIFLCIPRANRYFRQDFVSICTLVHLRTRIGRSRLPKYQSFRPTQQQQSTSFSSSTPIFQLKTPKDPESSSGQSPADLMMSRPMSEESSMWDESETHDVRRRHNRNQVRLTANLIKILLRENCYVARLRASFDFEFLLLKKFGKTENS